MRYLLKCFAAIAAGCLAYSCTVEIQPTIKTDQTEGSFEYFFRISDEPDASDISTKTTLDGNIVKWEANDRIGIYASGTVNKYGSITNLNPVQFPVYLASALTAGDKVYCYYPYNKDANDSKGADEITLTIPASQSGDFDAMPQVSIPYEVTSDLATGTNNVDDIYFCNIGSVAQFLVYSATGAYSSESVESITLTANTGLAGNVTFDLTAVDYSTPSSLAATGYSSKSATITASPSIGTSTGDAGVANLVIAPGTYYGTILLKTDKARYSYTISEPNKITFNRSKIKKLALDLESANCERVETHPVGEVFVPATSISDGDIILITSGTSGSAYVMGYQKNNNRDAISYTIDGGIISSELMYPLLVKTGTENASYFSLYDADTDGYLYAASSSNNYLRTQKANNVNSEWQIVLNASSQATTFKATGSENRNVMQFNSSLFSCYASDTYDPVYLFKKTTDTFITASDQNIAFNVTEVTIDYNVYNASGATTVTFNTNPGACASNLSINEGTKKVTFDITANTGATRTVKVDITNNGVTKTITINQASAPTKLVMSTITAAPSQNQIVFSWADVDDATGYQVSTDGGSSWGSTQVGTSYTWTGLSSFTSYTINVKAIADGVYHLDSDANSKTQKTTLALPTEISWSTATKTVTWTDTNTGAGSYGVDYKYQYTVDNGANFTDVAAPGSSVILGIAETKIFKIRAIYISDALYNSALSAGTTCSVGAGALYSANFDGSGEYRTSGTNYVNGPTNYTVSGVQWTFNDGGDVVTAGSVIDGTASAGFRIRKNQTNTPNAVTNNLLSSSKNITKVTYQLTKVSTITFDVEYSTDGGTSWSSLDASADEDVNPDNGYSKTLDLTTSDFRLRFTASVAKSTTSNRDVRLDNVKVFGE